MITKKCRNCGKELKNRLYCNGSCRTRYFQKLRSVELNKISPEKFIKTELAKPINPLMERVEIVNSIPLRIKHNEWLELLIQLDDVMQPDEIRRIKVDSLSQANYLRPFAKRRGLKFDMFSRKIGNNYYVYICKGVKDEF